MPARDFLLAGYEHAASLVAPGIAQRVQMTGEAHRYLTVEDGKLIDGDDREMHDFLAGWGTQALGHRPVAIASALTDFLAGPTPSFYTSGLSPYAGHLAHLLHQRTAYDAAFFVSGGSEAIEAALKLARASTKRQRIVGIEGAYHGCTYGSVAMMAAGPFRDGFEPHLPRVDSLPFGDLSALETALSDPNLAAIVMEPVQIEAGVRAPACEWLNLVCQRTAEQGILLIADEIQTGLGRCGHFLLSHEWPRQPDVVVLGKALGGGLMPLSVMLTHRAIFDRAYGDVGRAEVHASTFSGNALACVAGIAFLQQLDDALIANVQQKSGHLQSLLNDHIVGHPLVKDVRVFGLLMGIELQPPDHPFFSFDYFGFPGLSAQSAIGMLVVQRLQQQGFITQVSGHDWHVVRAHPPLIVSNETLTSFVITLKRVLDDVWALQ